MLRDPARVPGDCASPQPSVHGAIPASSGDGGTGPRVPALGGGAGPAFRSSPRGGEQAGAPQGNRHRMWFPVTAPLGRPAGYSWGRSPGCGGRGRPPARTRVEACVGWAAWCPCCAASGRPLDVSGPLLAVNWPVGCAGQEWAPPGGGEGEKFEKKCAPIPRPRLGAGDLLEKRRAEGRGGEGPDQVTELVAESQFCPAPTPPMDLTHPWGHFSHPQRRRTPRHTALAKESPDSALPLHALLGTPGEAR